MNADNGYYAHKVAVLLALENNLKSNGDRYIAKLLNNTARVIVAHRQVKAARIIRALHSTIR